jgi:hypothetical protein
MGARWIADRQDLPEPPEADVFNASTAILHIGIGKIVSILDITQKFGKKQEL